MHHHQGETSIPTQEDLVSLITSSLRDAGHPQPQFWISEHAAQTLAERDPSSQVDAVRDIWLILLCKCSEDTSAARFTLSWGGDDIAVYASAFQKYVLPVVMQHHVGFDPA